MPSRAVLMLAMLSMAAAADPPPPRWGAAVAVLPSPPTLLVQGGKVQSEGQTYNSAPNSADTYMVPLNDSFPANNPPYKKLSPKNQGPAYSWHCLAPLYKYEDKWTLLSFGGDGGWSEPRPGGQDSAWLVNVNPDDGFIDFDHKPAGWAKEPSRRKDHSCAAPAGGGKVYITGGQADDGSADYSEMWMFDPDPMQFTSLPSLPNKVYGHSSVLLDNGTLMVIGGVDAESQSLIPLNTVHVFDTTSNQSQWKSVDVPGDAPGGRRGASATLIDGNNVLLFGGANENLTTVFGDAWVFNPETLHWNMVMNDESGPGARFDAAVAYVGNGQVTIVGGYNADGPVSGDFHVLNVVTGAPSAGNGGANAGAGGAGGGAGGAMGTATAVPSFLPGGQTGANGAGAGAAQTGLSQTGGVAGSTQTGVVPQATQASSFTTGSGDQIATSINTRSNKPGESDPPRPRPQSQPESSHTGRNAAIIGSIVGCACLVFLGLILFFWCRRRKRDRKYQEEVAQRRLMKEGDAEAWAAHMSPPSSPKSRFAGMAALGAGAGAVAATLRKISGGRNPEYQAVSTDEPKGTGIAPKRRSTRYVGQKMRLVGHSEGHDPFSDNYSEDLPFEGNSTARSSAFGPGVASTEVGMRQRQVSNEHSPIAEEDEEIPIGGRWATANLILGDSHSDATPVPTSPTRMSRASFMASEDEFNLLAPIPRRPLTEGALLAEVPSRDRGVSGASTSGTSMAELASASLEHGSRVPLQSDAPMLWDVANKAPVSGQTSDIGSALSFSGSDLVPPALLLRLGEHSGSESSSVNSKHRMVARAIAEPRGIGSEHGEIDETSFRDSRSSRASAAHDGQFGTTSRYTFGSMKMRSSYVPEEEDPDATPVAPQQPRFSSDTGLSDLIPDFGSVTSSLVRLNVPSVLERGGSDSSGTYSASTWGSNVASMVDSSRSGISGSTAGTYATAPSEVAASVVSTASTVGSWTTAPPQNPPEIEEELAALRDATPIATPRLNRVDTNPENACVETPRVVSAATVTGLGMRNVSMGDSPGSASGIGSGLQRSSSGSSTMAVVGSQPTARERALNRSLEGIDPPRGLGEFKSPPPSLAPSLPPSPMERQPWPEFAPTCRPSPSASIFTVPAFPDAPDPFQDPVSHRDSAGSAGTIGPGAAMPGAFTTGETVPADSEGPSGPGQGWLGGTSGVEIGSGSDVSDAIENLASPVMSPAPSPKPRTTLAGMAGLSGSLSSGLGGLGALGQRGKGRLRPVREAIDSINRRGAALPSRFASGGSRDFTPTPPKTRAGSASATNSPAAGAAAAADSPTASPALKKSEGKDEFHLRPTHRYNATTSSPSASYRTARESASAEENDRVE